MSSDTRIVQKAGIGSDTTQIGVQNNYGISAEEASRLAINLFMDNFPKLQEEAKEIARVRAEELCKEVIDKLVSGGKSDYSEFTDPDVQYVFYEAQKGYARFGEKETLQMLRELIVNRVNFNETGYMKRIYDKAIEMATLLTSTQIDYLTFIFIAKHVKFQDVTNIEKLKHYCEYISSKLPLSESIINSFSYLNMIGCFELGLGSVEYKFSEVYHFGENEIKSILPNQYDLVPEDYQLSAAAIAIAIINANCKMEFNFDINVWVYE